MHCCEKPQAIKCGAGPLAPLYYSGQFVPLIVFFLLFLSIVKNNKLHHFVRFHCMQVRAGLPGGTTVHACNNEGPLHGVLAVAAL